jgi:hypothetical protein
VTRPGIVSVVAVAVLGLCGYSALLVLEVFDREAVAEPLGLYMLGKAFFCAGSLILASAFLEEVRGLRADAVRAGLMVRSAVRPDPLERAAGLRAVGGLLALLPLAACGLAAALEFNLFGLLSSGDDQTLAWYFLGKGVYCFESLLLTHATLHELRALRGPVRMEEES